MPSFVRRQCRRLALYLREQEQAELERCFRCLQHSGQADSPARVSSASHGVRRGGKPHTQPRTTPCPW